jgi:DNA-binding CsgD family transcriptional regulator
LLSRGLSLEQAADQRGVSLNTARGQLKRIFSKTQTNRQAELVRLVLQGPAGFSAS